MVVTGCVTVTVGGFVLVVVVVAVAEDELTVVALLEDVVVVVGGGQGCVLSARKSPWAEWAGHAFRLTLISTHGFVVLPVR